jgi:hypothetical protein
MNRATVNIAEVPASPAQTAVTAKITEVRIITPRRPMRSARNPATSAPAAHPRRIEATAKPVPTLEVWKPA